jgi:hypothetical protein
MKPFKETKIGKILTNPIIKGAIKSIPLGVGSLAANILDETTTSEPGKADLKTIIPQLLKLAFYGYLAYQFLNGVYDADAVKDAQKIIEF